jgi:hypothetical protein
MMNMKILHLLILALIAFSCASKSNVCDVREFNSLDLYSANASIRLPAYKVTDTIAYGDLSNIFERKVKSFDSSLIVFAGVKSYEKNLDAMPDIDSRMKSQKEQIEGGQDSIRVLINTFKMIDTVKVGYLKNFDEKRMRYEGRFFFNRGSKFVDIWLYEKFVKTGDDKKSIIDCIFESIEIR